MKTFIIVMTCCCLYLIACAHHPKEASSTKAESSADTHKLVDSSSQTSTRSLIKPKLDSLISASETMLNPRRGIEEQTSVVSNSNNSIKDDKNTATTTKKDSPMLSSHTINHKKVQPAVSVDTESIDTVFKQPSVPVILSDHFDDLLRSYVSSKGVVDYNGFRKNKATLIDYIENSKKNSPTSSWSNNKEMAYWINLYNAFTILSIVEKYPIKSILDLEGGNIWDNKKFIVGGKSLSLNQIEKERLLQRFNEPNVHFAVNCAAASCPPLLNKAWTEDNIQAYFAKQAKAFINNSKYNKISADKIEVSQIFNWYAKDFGGKSKLISFLNKYASVKINSTASIQFIEYDWTLNNK